MLVTLCIGIHVVLGIAFMWLKGLQLVAQLLEGVVAMNKAASTQPLGYVCALRQTQFACIFTNDLSITNASSQLHLWLEGLLLIFTLNASVPAMHVCVVENPPSCWRYHCSVKGNWQVVLFLLQHHAYSLSSK